MVLNGRMVHFLQHWHRLFDASSTGHPPFSLQVISQWTKGQNWPAGLKILTKIQTYEHTVQYMKICLSICLCICVFVCVWVCVWVGVGAWEPRRVCMYTAGRLYVLPLFFPINVFINRKHTCCLYNVAPQWILHRQQLRIPLTVNSC